MASPSNTWSPLARVYDPLQAGSIDGTDTYPHDRAITRAQNAKYKTPEHIVSDPVRTVFVGRLSHKTSEDRLQKEFSRFGNIQSCHLVRDIVTGLSKCYGFIEYVTEWEARLAARDANDMTINGSTLLVEMECERVLPGWIPRRLGGGFGGRKESGQLRFGGRDRPFKKPIFLRKSDRDDDDSSSRKVYKPRKSYSSRDGDNVRDRYHRH